MKEYIQKYFILRRHNFQVAVKKADLSRYMSLVAAMKEAEEIYYLANGKYTNDLRLLDIEPPSGEDCVLTVSTSGAEGFYTCKNGTVKYGVWGKVAVAQAGDNTIRYSQYFADDVYNGWGLKGYITCQAKGRVAIKVCETLGGQEISGDGENVWKMFLLQQ